MSDERILEVVENQDKYYILGFIKGLKTNIDELQQENQQLKEQIKDIDMWTRLYNEEFDKNKQLKIQISAREEEYIKLENNWNELKEWIIEVFCLYIKDVNANSNITRIINKMNKLESRCK